MFVDETRNRETKINTVSRARTLFIFKGRKYRFDIKSDK